MRAPLLGSLTPGLHPANDIELMGNQIARLAAIRTVLVGRLIEAPSCTVRRSTSVRLDGSAPRCASHSRARINV
jgi:hypothetical protein